MRGTNLAEEWIAAWAACAVASRKRVIAVTALLFASFTLLLPGLRFDNSYEYWFIPDDPALVAYQSLLTHFGDNEYVLIGVAARADDEDLFTPATFSLIYQLNDFLENHPRVIKVKSLANYRAFVHRDGKNILRYLVPYDSSEFDGSSATMAEARTIMAWEGSAHGLLITSDLRHTLIIARTRHTPDDSASGAELVGDIRRFVEQAGFAEQGFDLHLSGPTVVNEAFFRASLADLWLTFPLMGLLIVGVLWGLFRSLSATLLPLLIVVITVVIGMGCLVLLDWPLNILNIALPVILMAVGISDAIHLLLEFRHQRAIGHDRQTSAGEAVRILFRPCLFTSLTTALGFVALSVSHLEPLRQFGIVAAIGVMVAFLLSMTLLPALFVSFDVENERTRPACRGGRIAAALRQLRDPVLKHRTGVLYGALLLFAASLWGGASVKVDSNFLDFLKQDNPLNRDFAYFVETWGGQAYLEYLIDSGRPASGDAPGGVVDVGFLERVEAFQHWLDQQQQTGKTLSMINHIARLHQGANGNDAAYYRIPEDPGVLQRYVRHYRYFGGSDNLVDLKSEDDRYLRVSQLLKQMTSREMFDFINKTRAEIAERFPDLDVTLTGVPVLYSDMDNYVFSDMARSALLATILVVACLLLPFRSLRLALPALITSLLPVLMAIGLMGFLDVPLNFVAIVIVSITMGIAIDDTIHLISRYLHHRRDPTMDGDEAMTRAIVETGTALSMTTLILVAGFATLMLSNFVPNIQLGFYSVVILIAALLATLVLLPLLLPRGK